MIKISWEHWNSKETCDLSSIDEDIEYSDGYKDDKVDMSYITKDLEMIHTPFGSVPKTSRLKPSDRWDCWLGYTNTDITHSIEKRIAKIPGVESLAIMGRYTFCIGVGKLFEFSSVRKEIENELRK